MIKLSKMTDYAVVILNEMAGRCGQLMSTSSIAEVTGLAEPTVSKVTKLMVKAEIIRSVRGANGGYVLDYAPQDIKIIDVITAIDGPIAVTSCTDKIEDSCALEKVCTMKGRWSPVNEAIYQAIAPFTLAHMTSNDIAPEQQKTA